jgi:two-component system sensor histidine kinase KdpD
MKKFSNPIKNILIMVVFLLFAFGISLLFHYIFDVSEHVITVFVFSVFLISLFTEGYLYGVLSAFIGTIAVNYAFTFPFFAFDFTTPVNLISGIIMISIAILTGALTTKLKRHEAMKSESEKESMRANLLRAVSHDIRTPLTTIYGSSTILLDNNNLPEEEKNKILLGIKEDSKWLVRMVENLLSVTRIDSGQVKIIKAPIVLEELIDSVMLKFKKHYSFQNIEINIPDDVIIIPMDAILIEQVIFNIFENAIQHAKGMTKLYFKVYVRDKKAIFELKDNGCGISPKRMETLFNGTFTTENIVADSKKKNTGIGLSVCSTIIKAHGGNIKAENISSGGALFRFDLSTEE